MTACEVEVEIVVIEVDLDATLITKHFADAACLCVGVNFAIYQLDILPLGISNNKHFPHVSLIQLLEIMLVHKHIKPLHKLLPLFRFLKRQYDQIIDLDIWQ